MNQMKKYFQGVFNRSSSMIVVTVFLLMLSIVNIMYPADNVRSRPDRDPIVDIVKGKPEKAVTFYLLRLEKQPNDPEIFYGLAMAYSRMGKIEKAMVCVDQAVKAGLAFERFLAGPRNLFKRLYKSKEFREYVKKYPIELLHGPTLGAVTDRCARFWVRTAHPVSVIVSVSDTAQQKQFFSQTVTTDPSHDYTAVAEVQGLAPDTKYYYHLTVNSHLITLNPRPWFRTNPSKHSKPKFQVAFGGCANYRPANERMWDTILSHQPLAMLLLGDNVYIDFPEIPEVQRFCYYQRFSRAEFRRLTASASIYAIYDDHDFGDNDVIGGPEIETPKWKRAVWRIFKETFNNPTYGGGEKQPGCWFNFSIGPVDFFMLDCRYYHTDPTSATRSMLGPVQKQWLLEKLKSSHAAIKVLASSVPWTFGAKPGKQITARGVTVGASDAWEGFPEEREEIFSFIEQNRIEGVYLLSCDRHRSDAWKIERSNGYTFFEAETAHLTKNGEHPLMPKAIFSHRGKPMFGLLTFDFTLNDPKIIYQVIDIDDQLVDELVVNASQLKFRSSQ